MLHASLYAIEPTSNGVPGHRPYRSQYTLVWNANATKYYFDGKLVGTLTTNVPSEPSYFVWNAVSTHPAIAPHIAWNQLTSCSVCGSGRRGT